MQKSVQRRHFLSLAALATLPVVEPLLAQDVYPAKPIRIIVPYPPGGAVDSGIRILAEQLQGILRQTIVVDNKPGGLFTISMQALSQAPADGYTLLATNTSFVAVQLVQGQYEMQKQLMPVSSWSHVDVILAAALSAPFTSLKEMIEWAKANPGKLNYASIGPGTLEHLNFAFFAKKYGFEATQVPFKGGPDAMLSLAKGETHVFTAVLPLVNQFKTRVRALGVMSEKRTPSFPDVPTFKELGIDVPPFQFWNGLHASAGTPAAVMNTLQRAIAQALAAEVTRTKFDTMGMIPFGSTSARFGSVVSDEFKNLAEAVRSANLPLN